MSCPTNEQIHQYVEGELSPQEAVAIRAHILECADCQKRREAALDAIGTLSSSPVTASPAAPAPEPAPPAGLPEGPLEHCAAVVAGYKAGYEEKLKFGYALERGIRYVQQIRM